MLYYSRITCTSVVSFLVLWDVLGVPRPTVYATALTKYFCMSSIQKWHRGP